MTTHNSRREWLKKAAFLGAGFTTLPSFFESAIAHPVEMTSVSDYFQLERREANRMPFAGNKIRLNANENPYGPSPKAKQAIIDSLSESNRYYTPLYNDLIKIISQNEGVSEENILVSPGSSAILLAAFLEFNAKGSFLVGNPGYISDEDMIQMDKVPLDKDYKHDLEAMAARANPAKHSMVYICNPNNPTGTVVAPEKLRSFCEAVSAKIPVMIDEAYIDYTADPKKMSVSELIKKGQNVIVVRTMSKLHAFAGLRVGYCIAQPGIIKTLSKYTDPMFVARPAVNAAVASFQDTEFLKMAAQKNAETKQFTYDFLKKLGYSYIPSETNFVIFPIKMKGQELLKKLDTENVWVRRWEFDKQHWCRVSMGTMDEMKAFAAAFTKIIS